MQLLDFARSNRLPFTWRDPERGDDPAAAALVAGLEEDHEIVARAVLLATGAQYRRPPVDALAEYEGISVFHAAEPPEAQLCGGGRAGVVGGGNSAGQAAVWLARGGALVTLLHRRADLRETMSDYLVRELERYSIVGSGSGSVIVDVRATISAITATATACVAARRAAPAATRRQASA